VGLAQHNDVAHSRCSVPEEWAQCTNDFMDLMAIQTLLLYVPYGHMCLIMKWASLLYVPHQYTYLMGAHTQRNMGNMSNKPMAPHTF